MSKTSKRPSPVVDINVERQLRAAEAFTRQRRTYRPATFSGARLSEDNATIVLDVGPGPLSPGAAETLAWTLLELVKVAKGASR